VIKLIVFAVIGLVIGLGGGSGVAIMRASKTVVAVRDSAAVKDSTADGEKQPGAKSTHAPEGEQHVGAPAAKDSAPIVRAIATAPDSAAVVKPAPAPAVVNAPVTKPVPDTGRGAQPPAPGRISKIFAAMSARDASRVLEQLEDSDVQAVLAGLNDKQAAAILSGFPPARAAAISRAALRGKKAGL
jgi:hypothetical protein